MYCASLNVIGSHKSIGSGTIRKCGFVGVGMALLQKCVTVGAGFGISYAEDTESTSCCLLIKM